MQVKLKPGETLSVMVVDDEDDLRETLCTFLEMMELFTSIVQSADGAEAYSKWANQSFDLIITDLMMPKVRGIELIQNIKNMEKKKRVANPVPMIILSANLTGEEVKKAIHFGVKHAITKPCTAQQFIDKVQEVLVKEQRAKLKIKKDE